MDEKQSRRRFLSTAGIGAGLALGGFQATSAGYAANETINVGIIGSGGRARHLMVNLAEIPGAKMVAVCDVWDEHLSKGQDLADPDAFATKHYEEILSRSDIDAVLIGAPDHWHVPMMIAACEAGKDVYVEKPLTHDLSEGPVAIAARDRAKRVVQVGMQQRSMPHLIEAKKMVESGQLGTIRKVHLTWNRNAKRSVRSDFQLSRDTVDWKRFLGKAPDQPFDPYRFRNWRWFWDFGGGIFTDLMVHYVDVAHWYLGVDHPAAATSIGNTFTDPEWETPDTVQTLMQYEKPEVQIYFEGTFYNARNRAMMEYMGSEATLYCDRGRYEVIPEPGKSVAAKELVLGSGDRGSDFFDQPNGELLHLANWLECIRTGATPNAPVEAGVSAASAAHIANKALRKGQVAHWEV